MAKLCELLHVGHRSRRKALRICILLYGQPKKIQKTEPGQIEELVVYSRE